MYYVLSSPHLRNRGCMEVCSILLKPLLLQRRDNHDNTHDGDRGTSSLEQEAVAEEAATLVQGTISTSENICESLRNPNNNTEVFIRVLEQAPYLPSTTTENLRQAQAGVNQAAKNPQEAEQGFQRVVVQAASGIEGQQQLLSKIPKSLRITVATSFAQNALKDAQLA